MKYIKTYEAIVYHGSPNEFETFNTDYIGKTSNREFFDNGIYFSVDKAEANNHGKHVYKVEIPDVNYFLNFDISFEEQSKYIQKCLNKIDIEIKDKMLLQFNRIEYNDIIQSFKDDNINSKTYQVDLKKLINSEFKTMNDGRAIYYSLSNVFEYDTRKISDYLYSLGIIGNVYDHDGITNYVLFNAKDIKVLNKNIVNESVTKNVDRNILFEDVYGKQIVYDDDLYRIAVDDENDARYITLWFLNKNKWTKVGVLDAYLSKMNYKDRHGKYLSINLINIEPKHRNKRFSKLMYRALIDFSSDDIKGIYSYLPNRSNKKQVPHIYKQLHAITDGDYQFIDFNN